MFENLIPVPNSGRRYYVNEIGQITTNTNVVIKTFKENDEIYIELDWVLGRRKYLVSIIVLVSFGLLKIPDYLLDEVIPLYRDNSKANLSPINLLYKFKNGRIEVEGFPGFYYIPFYVDYAINVNGELINIKTGKYKSWSITKPNEYKNATGGYRYSRVVNDLGFSKTLFQHRALCYVFKDYNNNVLDLVVNHIDGNPENNSINNLELVSHKRNNIHAVEIGLRGDNKPVLSRNIKTGEVIRFESIAACGRYYGQPRAGFVVHRLKNKSTIYSDMLQFKYDDGTPWNDVPLENIEISRIGKAELILARNVFTGKIIFFNGSSDGEILTGVKKDTILLHVRENKNIPIKGWNFRWSSDDITWPEHTEKHLKIYSKFPIYPPDGAIVIDVDNSEELFFESVSLACCYLKITKAIFHNSLRSGKPINGKYNVRLFRLRENLGHPTE